MKAPEIENDWLDIHDRNHSTEGGSPAWLAFSMVFTFFLPAGIIIMMLIVLATKWLAG